MKIKIGVSNGKVHDCIFSDCLETSTYHIHGRHHRNIRMIKRFITWLYIKYVVLPDAEEAMEAFGFLREEDLEINFEPDEELSATIEASRETKH